MSTASAQERAQPFSNNAVTLRPASKGDTFRVLSLEQHAENLLKSKQPYLQVRHLSTVDVQAISSAVLNLSKLRNPLSLCVPKLACR